MLRLADQLLRSRDISECRLPRALAPWINYDKQAESLVKLCKREAHLALQSSKIP